MICASINCLSSDWKERDRSLCSFEDQQLTYRVSINEPICLAYLRTLDMGPEVLVQYLHWALAINELVGILGILKAGGACPSTQHPARRLKTHLTDAQLPLTQQQ